MIFILADDLTGANDSGVQYQKQGWSAAVMAAYDPQRLPALLDRYDMVAVNADSRPMAPQKAYRTNYRIARDLARFPHSYLYKKIDSLLRGNPAQELDAAIDATGAGLCVVAPSYPPQGRVVREGILYRGGEALLSAHSVLAGEMSHRVGSLPLDALRRGPDAADAAVGALRREGCQVILADAVEMCDLDILARLCRRWPPPLLLCGTAGFAEALSRLEAPDHLPAPPPISPSGAALFVLGTRSAETARQVDALRQSRNLPALTLPAHRLLEGDSALIGRAARTLTSLAHDGSPAILLMLDSLFQSHELRRRDSNAAYQNASAIVHGLGSIVRQAVAGGGISAVFACGGDTAREICAVLSIHTLELRDEVLQGVPVCGALREGAPPLVLITKSGGFGTENTLVRVLEYLCPAARSVRNE